MNRSVSSVVILALLGYLCVAEIVLRTSKPKHLTRLCDAAIDMLMTCHGDPGSAVGIVGDSDGCALIALQSKYFIPVVLINHMLEYPESATSRLHELQVFVIAVDSQKDIAPSVETLRLTRWWNQHAHFIFIDLTPDYEGRCEGFAAYMHIPTYYGLLNAQYICYDERSSDVWIFNTNHFTSQAPPAWRLVATVMINFNGRPISVFARRYRKGVQACEALNFPKTLDIGGWPLHFLTEHPPYMFDDDDPKIQKYFNSLSDDQRTVLEERRREMQWFMDNIVKKLNARAVIVTGKEFYKGFDGMRTGLSLTPFCLSTDTRSTRSMTRNMILPLTEIPLYAVTNHTRHMSQLEKILSVIDGNSRIGMWLVYLITFLFFKFFLRQAVVPALLNLVRLTCNTGLPNLPSNLAPTIYLASLLMFVVTLQAIYTGNLATLLTTTIAYRNVQTRQDIVYLGYTVYTVEDTNLKLAADPILHGHIVEIPREEDCIEYLLGKPLAVCILEKYESVYSAIEWNFHVSRDPMVHEFPFHAITTYNPLGRRLESILRRWTEHGLRNRHGRVENLRLLHVNDDEVNKNTDRRVMNLEDLRFAFVILGVGLLCSFVCFIGEMVIWKIRLKMAQRRNRVRNLALGTKKKSFLSFRALKFRFNARRFFSKRR